MNYIYHNILFNYLILKGYLEDEKDRLVPAPVKTKQRSLKPKFIKEIIEELTEDYDLPDVEIRKVLIEELTKEQLMHEEAEERRRLESVGVAPSEELNAILFSHQVGDMVSVTIYRGGQQATANITLAEDRS